MTHQANRSRSAGLAAALVLLAGCTGMASPLAPPTGPGRSLETPVTGPLDPRGEGDMDTPPAQRVRASAGQVPPASIALAPAKALLARLAGLPGDQAVAAPIAGERAYGIERVGCRERGEAWVMLYAGRYDRDGEGAGALVVDARYRLAFHPGEEGVSRTDWWCAPKRRFCISPIGFGDWNGPLEAGTAAPFHDSRLFHASYGIEAGALHAIVEACETPTAPSEPG